MVFLLECILHAYNMLTDNNIYSVKLHNQLANLTECPHQKQEKTIEIYNKPHIVLRWTDLKTYMPL